MNYRKVHELIRRMHSSSSRRSLTSSEIRTIFLDYFIKNHGHTFIRSSPVVPFCDPTVAFVNAGMNQFKSIFLGNTSPASRRVANSQKCIRVGGKHNDLTVVGKDGYHHTFFEMLGNWSFGDYFKKEACTMAWDLLNGPYGINPSRLYVTYFGGDETLNIPPDNECREIWRSLGVPDERILPFSSKDNFWEMGTTGPCGPCTEIHIDHLPGSDPSIRSRLVNAGQPELTELWNLVFIEYQRNADGSISPLPQKHIDTGMGLERLTAILQGKSTNYETDLFMPIFESIQKITNSKPYGNIYAAENDNNALDTAYRMLADHSRMIIACLADGMLPDQNHKLRRIIRKSFLLSSNIFLKQDLLATVLPQVAESLGPTYPEMQTKLSEVLTIIANEHEIFTALKESCSLDVERIISNNKNLEELDLFDSPGFVPAYKELQKIKSKFTENMMPGNFAYKLRDTYGLDEETIEKLALAENLTVDMNGYRDELIKAKERSKETFSTARSGNKLLKEASSLTANLKDTENFYKYNYKFNPVTQIYEMPMVKSKITGIIEDGKVVSSVPANAKGTVMIITEKSNFYYESGGQQSDRGYILKHVNGSPVRLDVNSALLDNGCVLHSGVFDGKCMDGNTFLSEMDEVELYVDPMQRTKNILHHTATHLLNASARKIANTVTYQLSSTVTSDCLKLELGILGQKVNKQMLEKIESLIRHVIENQVPTRVKTICAQDVLSANDIVMVPGEVYPETGLRLLSIEDTSAGLISKELCCGTHVTSTAELRDFCLVNVKQTGRSRYAFFAVAGDASIKIREKGKEIETSISQCESLLKNGAQKVDAVSVRLLKLRNEILNSDLDLPYLVKLECLDRINALIKTLKNASKVILNEFVEIEMQNVLQKNPSTLTPYIVHFLKCSTMMEDVTLQKATRLCQDRPILVVSFADGKVKARCCVPKSLTNEFAANEWLEKVANVFDAQISPPKGQDPKEVCNMKPKKTQSSLFYDKLKAAISAAKKFASSNL